MDFCDDDLRQFVVSGALPLPAAADKGFVENEGARIWYSTYGAGPAVILLHSGLGHSGNWGYQVPALAESGYRAILIDSRGHGRSTRDDQPYSYTLMTSDVRVVMNALHLERAALVGWSDGACTAMVLADKFPSCFSGVFYFACNMDPSGLKEFVFEAGSALERCFLRNKRDYAELSATPDRFEELIQALGPMQREQPNYSADDLARIGVPVTIVQGERDEFIRREHAEYLAQSIPGAELVILEGVSHFAPLQRPESFNRALLRFLADASPMGVSPAVHSSGPEAM